MGFVVERHLGGVRRLRHGFVDELLSEWMVDAKERVSQRFGALPIEVEALLVTGAIWQHPEAWLALVEGGAAPNEIGEVELANAELGKTELGKTKLGKTELGKVQQQRAALAELSDDGRLHVGALRARRHVFPAVRVARLPVSVGAFGRLVVVRAVHQDDLAGVAALGEQLEQVFLRFDRLGEEDGLARRALLLGELEHSRQHFDELGGLRVAFDRLRQLHEPLEVGELALRLEADVRRYGLGWRTAIITRPFLVDLGERLEVLRQGLEGGRG